MQPRRLSWCAAAIAVTLFACGGDDRADLTPSPTGPQDSLSLPGPKPGAITRVSGNEQRALLGDMLGDPLVVQATDVGGMAMAGVRVEWTSPIWNAFICVPGESICVQGTRFVSTDAHGRSTVWARPAVFSVGAVTAAVTTNPALYVTFTMDAIGVLIRAQPLSSCIDHNDFLRFNGHPGSSHTIVDVGTPVEFEFATWLPPGCTARIVTTIAPIGNPGFDSGDLRPGQRFRFVPTMAGTWEFKDEYTGGVGWLTAGPLPPPPSFPPLSRPATVYNETVQVYGPETDKYSTRFVFFDDGTFQLQFSSQRFGWSTVPGRYSTTESIISLAFTDNGPAGKWEATASVSGDTLTVSYNQLMRLDDFINGRYIRAR